MNYNDIKDIDNQQKINMIFTYLFDDDKSLEEEFFWNNLNNDEIKKYESIRNEETYDLSNLKDMLWK